MVPWHQFTLQNFTSNRDVVSFIAVFGLMLSYILFYCVLFLAALTFMEVTDPVAHHAGNPHHFPFNVHVHRGSGDGLHFPVNLGQNNEVEVDVDVAPPLVQDVNENEGPA